MKLSRLLIRNICIFSLSLLLVITNPIVAVQGQPPLDLIKQARILFDAGKFQETVPLLEKVVAEFNAKSDRLNQAMALSNLAATWEQLAKWEEAQQNITTSLSLLSSLSQTPEQQLILAQTLNIQRNLQLERGRFQDAINTGTEVTKLYKQLNLKPQLISSQINHSLALQELGLYPKACKTLLAVFDVEASNCGISPDVKQKLQNLSPLVPNVRAINALGNILRVLGQLHESKQVLAIGLEMAQKLNLPEEQAAIYLNLGNTERAFANQSTLQAQQYVKFTSASLDDYTQASQLATRYDTQVQANLNRLSLLLQLKKWPEVVALGRSLSTQVSQLPANRVGLFAQINLAENLLKLARVSTGETVSMSEIDQILGHAYQQATLLVDPRILAYVLLSQSKLAQLQQQGTSAETFIDQAISLAPSEQYPDIAYQLFSQKGNLRKIQGDSESAIAQFTQSVDILSSLRGDLVKVNPSVQFSFRESVEPIYRELVGLLLQSKNPSQVKLKQARQTIESLQLAELDNFFRDACATAKPQLLDKIDPTAAVLYPIILGDRLDVILSIPGQPLRKYSTYKSQTELEKVFKQARKSLRMTAFREEQLQSAQQIYNWLIGPSEHDLAANGIKTLVFVLDGYLRNLSVASLHDGDRYIIEKYNIALAPGMQLLQSQPLKQVKLKMLVGALTEGRQGFSDLPGVASEIEQISTNIPSEKLVNKYFITQSLEKEVKTKSFSILHLATHGQFSSNAEETFILTWNERINVKELDQLLRSREQENQAPIELLVLSACETATGDDRAVLGLAGLAIRSGARSTVGTLWQVDDRATAIFFKEFYRQLINRNISKAEALRNAQLALMKKREFQNPYFWSPFVLIGNWL